MDVATVKRQIVQKQLDPFYIFAGEELELMWTYIRKMSEVTGSKIRYEEDYSRIARQLRNTSFIKQSFIYVFRDDPVLLKEEKLWDTLADKTGSIVILLLSTVDKRTKFFKAFKDQIVLFEPMAESVLIKYIQKEVEIPENLCKRLILACESNYGRILLELDKIAKYAKIRGFTPADVTRQFLDNGMIYEPPRDMIFEFAKQFLLRKPVATFQLMQECLEGGEAVLIMLTVLYTNIRQLLQVITCGSKDIAATTGLTTWQIKNAQEVKGHYTGKELVEILHTLHRLETGIKTGEVEEDLAVPYLLSCVM